jgi:hypothetical protein
VEDEGGMYKGDKGDKGVVGVELLREREVRLCY